MQTPAVGSPKQPPPMQPPPIRAGIARGWEFRNSVPRRPPTPDLHFLGGGKGIRTPDLLTASQALYQLSYTPEGRIRLPARPAPSESSGSGLASSGRFPDGALIIPTAPSVR